MRHRSSLAAHRVASSRPIIFNACSCTSSASTARDYAHSIAERDAKTTSAAGPNPATNGGYLNILAEHLRVFGAEHAQVLEYWLDVSRFSGWLRPSKKIELHPDVLRADLDAYTRRGLRHITPFATWIDAGYANAHGDPQPMLDDYGKALKG